MARKGWSGVIDLDNLDLKQRLQAFVGRLPGCWLVTIEPVRGMTRSNAANRRYWGYIVQPFAEFLAEQEETLHDQKTARDEAHRTLVCECLGYRDVRNPITGEVQRVPLPTHTLTSEAFREFVERCEIWLAKQVGIAVVPDPAREVSR